MDTTKSMYRSNEPPHARTFCALTVVHPYALAPMPVTHKNVTIGRGHGCDLSLSHGTVSRRHLALRWDAESGHHLASDLGSRNGSRIGGVSIGDMPRLLEDNDVLQIGDVVAVYERHIGPISDLRGPEALFDAIPGDALSVCALRERVLRVACSREPVLLSGETGTGKEWIARLIHALSGRTGEIISVNCGALSTHLVESLLFGHERGAFTGAGQARIGLFRAAERGTLFLDEIGELPRDLQPKLLRAAEYGLITPVGSTREQRVDARIVAATHRDLPTDIERDLFRRDLHARLARQELRVPPLRERRVDIFSWLGRFLKRAADARGLERAPDPDEIRSLLTPSAAAAIVSGDWLNNLRGLERLANELVHHADAELIKTWMLPSWTQVPEAEPVHRPPRTDPVRPPKPDPRELEEALKRFGGSIRAVAGFFGRDRSLIRRWIARYQLSVPAPAGGRDYGQDDECEGSTHRAPRTVTGHPMSAPQGALPIS